MLKMLRRVAEEKRLASQLYGEIARRSRDPVFFAELGVADTFDGRFDLTALHAWMVLDALKHAGLDDVGQRLLQVLFESFDDSLRDQGAGDMGIGRRSKAMTSALFGRMKAYQAAADDAAMVQALMRNLYRDAPGRADCASRVARYIDVSRKSLAAGRLDDGIADFGAPPEVPH